MNLIRMLFATPLLATGAFGSAHAQVLSLTGTLTINGVTVAADSAYLANLLR